jgi:uncharacterized protein YjiS (DUF1127 family)
MAITFEHVGSSRLSVLAQAIRTISLRKLYRNWQSRGKVKRMECLNDWQLHDVGLSRSDLLWVLSLPLSSNAEQALLDRIVDKRNGRA